jgi:hypothetical protein
MNEKRSIGVMENWSVGFISWTSHYAITPSRHHAMNPLQHILVFAIRVYRWTISPAQIFLFGPTSGCRFTPTCSKYAMEAIHTRGALLGVWLALKRICRCHPWGERGHDPVPECGIRNAEGGKTSEHVH